MTFAYPRNTGASAPNSLPLYNPKRSQSPNLISRVADFIPPAAKQWLSVGGIQRRLRRAQEAGTRVTRKNFVKSVFSIQNAIVLLWMLSIRWGERTVFDDHIKQCLWDSWEEWVSTRAHAIAIELAAVLTQSPTASRCNSTSYRLHRRPSASRSTHLPRSTLAAIDADDAIHGPIYAPIILLDSRPSRAGLGVVPW
jgi:hypothetical protein